MIYKALRSSRRRTQRKLHNLGLYLLLLPPSQWKSPPPFLSLTSSSSPHSVSSASSSHTSLCPREQRPAHTHRHTLAQTPSAQARRHLVSEIRNLRHQRVRLLSPRYLAWTTWPRVRRGAREQREEEWRQE